MAMASCILPAFSTIPPDFSSPARFDTGVDARIRDWGSSMYPERFGVVESSQDHAMESMSSAHARSSIVSPCKIEPDCAIRPSAAPSDLSHYSPGLDQYLLPHKGGGNKRRLADVAVDMGTKQKKPAAMDHSECGSLQSVQDTAATTAGAAASPPLCSSPSKMGEPDHEVHIWTERERRKKMRSMFVTLHSMLPKVPSKADKSTIVDEAINYIKQLEQKMHQLLKKKSERAASSSLGKSDGAERATSTKLIPEPEIVVTQRGSDSSFRTLSSSNVVFNLCGSDVFITICASARPNLLSRAFTCVIEMLKLDVRNVQITDASDNRRLLMIHACATDVTRTSEGDLKNVMQELVGCIRSP